VRGADDHVDTRGMLGKLMPLVLAAAGLVAFWPYLHGPFVLDDLHTILQNVYIRENLNPVYFFNNPQSISVEPSTMTRPLLAFFQAVNYRLSEDSSFGYHLANLIIHVMNAVLVTLLTARAGRLKKAAPFCGLLFLLLPVNSLGVAYVSCRSTLIAAFFYLGGLLLFASARQNPSSLSYLKTALYVAGIGALYAGGIFTKPTASTLPAAIVLWAVAFPSQRTPEKKKAGFRFVLAVTALLVFIFGLYLFYRQVHAAPVLFPPARPWPVWQYAAAQVRAFWTYLSLMAWPVNLSLEHQTWKPDTVSALLDARFLLSASALVVMLGLAARFLRRLPELAFPALFAVLWLLPTSSVVPLNVLVSENRAYLACLVFVWPVALLFLQAREKRPAAASAVMVIVALLFTGVLWSRAQVFQSEESVWRDTVRKSPGLYRAWSNLGTVMLIYGRTKAARPWFEKALEIDPCASAALNNLGNIAIEGGRWDEAEKYYRRALSCSPENAVALYNLSGLLQSRGREEEARALMKKLDRFRPGRLEYLRQKGVASP